LYNEGKQKIIVMRNAISLKVDSRGRIAIGSLLKNFNISSVKAFFDEEKQNIILEPYVEVSVRDAWLFNNKEKLKSVLTGLEQAKNGEVEYLGDFSKYAK
jgi:hypothetical protein